ncbi:MAG: phosphoribosylanthranilate isomerase, partial [Elusimicrobiota bacterium]|nr:phosphoribosylanthranilate isomerase [Elusimicrobiota bacterium]
YEPVGVFVDEQIDTILKVVKKCQLRLVQLHGKESPEYCKSLHSLLVTHHSQELLSDCQPGRFLQRTTGVFEKERICVSLIKAFRIKSEATLKYISRFKDVVDYFLVDTYVPSKEGGTGEVFNWEIAVEAKKYNKPIFLAGGLTPENVKDAIEKVAPFAVDVASGVERLPRRKDYEKLKNFILNVKSMK